MNPQPPPGAGYDENLTVNLTVSLHKVWDDECVIDLKLTNTTNRDLEVLTHSLPWQGHYSMALVPMDSLPGGTPVLAPAIIDDAPLAFTTIKPNQSLQGEIHLAERFPSLVKLLKLRELILFWAYQPTKVQPTTVNQTRGKWVGGWLILPKLP